MSISFSLNAKTFFSHKTNLMPISPFIIRCIMIFCILVGINFGLKAQINQPFTVTYDFVSGGTSGVIDPSSPTSTYVSASSASLVGAASITTTGSCTNGSSHYSNNYSADPSFNPASPPSSYWEITLTPSGGRTTINVTSISFTGQRSGSGPRSYSIRYSNTGSFSGGGTQFGAASGSVANNGCNTYSESGTINGMLNTSVIIRIYLYDASNATNGTLTVDEISIGTAQVLPIELQSFSGVSNPTNCTLNWTTSSELNNDKFIIETSTEGEVFNRIGEIDGAGTTTETHDYTFTHHTPSAGVNYYRLKQVDFDGTFAYSKVIAINAPGSKDIFAFPNPAKDKITVQYDYSKGAGNIQLFDALGRRVNANIAGYAGNYEVKLPEGLAKGTYWLKVERSGQVQTVPVVKE